MKYTENQDEISCRIGYDLGQCWQAENVNVCSKVGMKGGQKGGQWVGRRIVCAVMILKYVCGVETEMVMIQWGRRESEVVRYTWTSNWNVRDVRGEWEL